MNAHSFNIGDRVYKVGYRCLSQDYIEITESTVIAVIDRIAGDEELEAVEYILLGTSFAVNASDLFATKEAAQNRAREIIRGDK